MVDLFVIKNHMSYWIPLVPSTDNKWNWRRVFGNIDKSYHDSVSYFLKMLRWFGFIERMPGSINWYKTTHEMSCLRNLIQPHYTYLIENILSTVRNYDYDAKSLKLHRSKDGFVAAYDWHRHPYFRELYNVFPMNSSSKAQIIDRLQKARLLMIDGQNQLTKVQAAEVLELLK